MKYNCVKYENGKMIKGLADTNTKLILYENGDIDKCTIDTMILGTKEEIENIRREFD